jgi:hypothetical protein
MSMLDLQYNFTSLSLKELLEARELVALDPKDVRGRCIRKTSVPSLTLDEISAKLKAPPANAGPSIGHTA